jgi:hypothetical protein
MRVTYVGPTVLSHLSLLADLHQLLRRRSATHGVGWLFFRPTLLVYNSILFYYRRQLTCVEKHAPSSLVTVRELRNYCPLDAATGRLLHYMHFIVFSHLFDSATYSARPYFRSSKQNLTQVTEP